MTQTATKDEITYDRLAQRVYLQSLIDLVIPPGPRPAFEDQFNKDINLIERMIQGGAPQENIKRQINSNPQLARLLVEKSPPAEETTEQSANEVPQLSSTVKANEALAHLASPTLDKIIAFFKMWATKSYDGYHEAVALWVLSTIAARRIKITWQDGIWTTLYIMLVSDSTAYAKTKAASYGQKIINDCGLGYLLTPDEFTPQKLLSLMAKPSIPNNYAQLSDERKEYIRLKAAFSGQKGWLYDEFGNKLSNIIDTRGPEALLYQLLKRLYDCKERYEAATISRGEDDIDMPSLSIIGTATPSCLEPIITKHKKVFDDGFFARIAFVVPPKNSYKTQIAPNEQYVVPSDIIHALTSWHLRLGLPECDIVDTQEREEQLQEVYGDEKKKGKQPKELKPFEITKGELPQAPMSIPSDVYRAYEAYDTEMTITANNPANSLDNKFKSTYGRFPEKALRIAALLASLDNNGRLEMRHWARGQQVTEHWRKDYHELIAQLHSGEAAANYGQIEDLIINFLKRKARQEPGAFFSARDITQSHRTLRETVGTKKVREALNELADSEPKTYLQSGTGKQIKYRMEITK